MPLSNGDRTVAGTSLANTASTAEYSEFDIAIIGCAGRYPGAANLQVFWDNLCSGYHACTHFTDSELAEAGVSRELLADENYVRAAPVLEDADRFDARLFGYSPRDAELIDPQQRQLLELGWAGLENAAIDAENFDGRIGVFASTAMNTYLLHTALGDQFFNNYLPTLLGADKDFSATRLAYKLGLQGPAISVQTACSSSLVGIHLACQSLINEECDIALAAAATVRAPLKTGHLYEEGSVLSPDACCRPFDAAANGTVFGSGGGAVVLRRLVDAQNEGDPICAVIKGTAINNDGNSKSDFTAPSITLQADCISEAMAAADVAADSISYIEAHGTGTYLGDPIEIEALTRAYRKDTDTRNFAGIGSVKSNIGHLDAAAGMASLHKVVLALQHQQIPPTAHFKSPNPQIDFANSPFYVVDELQQWQAAANAPRRAGITSLGMGGTNAHIIVEEYNNSSQTTAASNTNSWQLVPLSAASPSALNEAANNVSANLEQNQQTPLPSVASTLQRGRKAQRWRNAVCCQSVTDLIPALREAGANSMATGVHESEERQLVMLFPGQGSQHPGMAKHLYQSNQLFRETIDRCADISCEVVGRDFRELLYNAQSDTTASLINQTQFAQPALYATSLAYAQLLRSYGFSASGYLGHSIGEWVAAALSGVVSADVGARCVSLRGLYMSQAEPGSMLSVSASAVQLQKFLSPQISVSVVNSSDNVVLGGSQQAIKQLQPELEASGISSRLLHTSHAFHTPMMDEAAARFRQALDSITLSTPSERFISSSTGDWITPEQATHADYWSEHICKPVQFARGLDLLANSAPSVLLECGPGNTLGTLATLNLEHAIAAGNKAASAHRVLSTAGHSRSKITSDTSFHKARASLWVQGVATDWSLQGAGNTPRIALPGYAFEGKRHWFQSSRSNAQELTDAAPATIAPVRIEPVRLAWNHWLHQGVTTQLPATTTHLPPSAGVYPSHRSLEEHAPQLARQLALLADNRPGSNEVTSPPRCLFYLCSASTDTQQQWLDLLRWCQEMTESADTNTAITLNILLQADSSGVQQPEQQNRGLSPLGAMASALAGCLNAEWPNIRVRVAELPNEDKQKKDKQKSKQEGKQAAPPEQSSTRLAFPDPLARLLTHPVTANEHIHWNGSAWMARRYEQNPLHGLSAEDWHRENPRNPAKPEKQKQPHTLAPPDKGWQILVGGFGGIGRELAGYLALQPWVEGLIITRRPNTEQSIEATGNSQAEWLAQLQRETHCDVVVDSLDLENAGQVASWLASHHQSGKALGHVFHLAGRVDPTPLSLIDTTKAVDILAPKISGTNNLLAAMAQAPGVPLVLFSSVTAITVPPGQAVYAAANAYQLAMAGMHNETPVHTVAWPGWRDTGMLASSADNDATRQATDHGMNPSDGIAWLMTALAANIYEAVISPVDLADSLKAAAFNHSGGNAIPVANQAALNSSESSTDNADDSAASGQTLQTPGNTTLARVSAHWQELLGVKTINPEDNYFDLGGTSLSAVKLMGKIKKSCGVALPIESILEVPTIASMVTLIDELRGDAPLPAATSMATNLNSPLDTSLASTPAPNTSGTPQSPHTPAPKQAPEHANTPVADRQKSLVTITGSTEKARSLVLVHAHGGTVIGYRKLAKLFEGKRPVLGLQSQGLNDGVAPLSTFESMAARYAEEIIERMPEEPLFLGGYCLGGTLALAVAAQLETAGHEVAGVFLLQAFHRDTVYPVYQNNRPTYPPGTPLPIRLSLYIDWLKAIRARAQSGEGESTIATLHGALLRAGKRLLGSDESEVSEDGFDNPALQRIHQLNGEAFWKHQPGTFSTPVWNFLAKEQPAHVSNDNSLGWNALAKGNYQPLEIQGSYLDALDELDLQSVATHIDTVMKGFDPSA